MRKRRIRRRWRGSFSWWASILLVAALFGWLARDIQLYNAEAAPSVYPIRIEVTPLASAGTIPVGEEVEYAVSVFRDSEDWESVLAVFEYPENFEVTDIRKEFRGSVWYDYNGINAYGPVKGGNPFTFYVRGHLTSYSGPRLVVRVYLRSHPGNEVEVPLGVHPPEYEVVLPQVVN